ncbi:MAG: glutaredoxin 3 [Erythrobacter sp.]|nr:glutaredoxin 3 [Erythrobacter sp.]
MRATADSARVVLYGTAYCPFCVRARRLLDNKGVAYADLRLEHQPELRREMERRSGRHTVPQIFIGDQHIGGSDELHSLERAGRLDALLRESKTDTERSPT